jgi:hypothetical protein
MNNYVLVKLLTINNKIKLCVTTAVFRIIKCNYLYDLQTLFNTNIRQFKHLNKVIK